MVMKGITRPQCIYDPPKMTGGDNSDGTIVFPNGFIEKWGDLELIGTDDTPLTFSPAFPNACFRVVVTYRDNTHRDWAPSADAITKTGCMIRHDAAGEYCQWIAIGR